MNNTPDSEAPRLVSRRTVAKTAAWAAPAIALAAASPAHAASDGNGTSSGTIGFKESSYTLTAKKSFSELAEGTLTLTGGEFPADMLLVATCSDGYEVLVQPVVSDGTFSVLVRATGDGDIADGTLTVSSSNYPDWKSGTVVLQKEAVAPPVVLPAGIPTIVWNQPYFQTVPGALTQLSGRLELPEGTVLADDFTLAAFSGQEGWSIYDPNPLTAVHLNRSDNTFTLVVKQDMVSKLFGEFLVMSVVTDINTPVNEIPLATVWTYSGTVS
ncbi:hypothetical protein ABCS02_16775 [Microbacterium sp. X-17]|uniref:hypothetical protein n=1 Tax=Microbacterium sp. X-17 TaxID=3144404 RepID=UPI0031F4F202